VTATATGTYATASALKVRLGITDTTDDTLLGLICDQVNQFIEGPRGADRILAPIASATYLFDVDIPTKRIYYAPGIRTVSLLEYASGTGAPYTTISSGYFVRPLAQDRSSGWPATWIELDNIATAYFHPGYETVRVTMTTGWAAIPDDIIDVALTTATRAWHARKNGQADIVGSDETGAPMVSRYVAPFHLGTLLAYRRVVPPA
jgi:hypothetical protein